MSKLSDADVARLLGALRSPDQAAAPEPEHSISSGAETARAPSIATALERALGDGSLRQALESSVRSYLGPQARTSLRALAADEGPRESLRFIATGSVALQLDLDERIAAALADIIIGGSGRNVKHGKPARVGRLLEPFARALLTAVAAAAGLDPPSDARCSGGSHAPVAGLAGGTIGIAEFDGAWRVSEAARAPSAPAAAMAAPQSQAPRAVAVGRAEKAEKKKAQSSETRPAPAAPRERVLAKRQQGPDDAFAAAVDAACRQLAEFTKCATAVDALHVTRVESPTLARGDLKLALIAGGQGSLVLSANRVAVASVAAAAVGADLPRDAQPGAVTMDAVEAVLRGAMRGFAEKLPAIAGAGARFVRLAEGALPARSPHYEIAAPIHIGQREATLQWLVPAWMAGSVAPSSPDAG
jgi:hypothetical protein